MSEVLVPSGERTDIVLASVDRSIFHFGAAIVAYNAAKQILVAIPVKTKSASDWARKGVTSADREKAKKAIKEAYA